MDKLPMREQQLASLTRDYEASKANYKSLLDKKMAAEMAANMERWQKAERFVMLDAARVPEKPTSPNRPVFMAGGVLLSLARPPASRSCWKPGATYFWANGNCPPA